MAVASVLFDIRAGVAKLNQDFARAEKRVDAGMQRVGSVMKKASIAMAAYFGANAIRSMVATTSAAASEMVYMSQRTGVAVEALAGLKHGAETSGASLGNLQRGLKNIAERSSDAAAGGETFAKRYARFGIELQNLDGTVRASDEILMDIADTLQAMPDGAAKTEAAMKLVGVEAGPKLLPMLSNGRAGLEAFREEADALGLTMSAETARSLEAFGTNVDRIKVASRGVSQAIISGLSQPLEAVTDALVGAVSGAERFAQMQQIAADVGEALIITIDVVAAGVRLLVQELVGSFQPLSLFGLEMDEIKGHARDLDAGLHSLALVMRTLGSVGRVVGWVFQVVGKAVAGVLGSIWYAITGRYREAMQIATMAGQDMVDDTTALLDDMKRTWTRSSKDVVDSAKGMGLGLSNALEAVKARAGDAARAIAPAARGFDKAGKDAAKSAADIAKLNQALRDNALSTQILVAEVAGDRAQVLRLQLQQETQAINDMLQAGEIHWRDAMHRRAALRKQTEREITAYYLEEQRKRKEAQDKALEEAKRESERARDVGFGIAESITQGLRQGFESDSFRDVLRSVVSMFSRIAMLIPGGQSVGMAGNIFAGMFADGGLIRGPGTGTSDSILARVSAGEFVARADSVRQFGVDFFDRLNQGVVDLSALPQYAGGGIVGTAPQAPAVTGTGQAPVVYIQAFDPQSTMEAMGQVWEPAQYRRAMSRQDGKMVAGMRRRILPARTGR